MAFINIANSVVDFLNTVVIPLLFAVCALAFLFGVFRYFFWSKGDEEAQKQGRAFVFWGVIALAVLFSTWGLVSMLLATFGIQSHP